MSVDPIVQLVDEGGINHQQLFECGCVSVGKLDGKIEMKPSTTW